MSLTPTDITKLASRRGVRKIAVENFLSTLGHEGPAGEAGARRNLYADAASYGWNAATVNAINAGIGKFFKPS